MYFIENFFFLFFIFILHIFYGSEKLFRSLSLIYNGFSLNFFFLRYIQLNFTIWFFRSLDTHYNIFMGIELLNELNILITATHIHIKAARPITKGFCIIIFGDVLFVCKKYGDGP